jgi:hypothetical protein
MELDSWEISAPAHLQYWPAHVHPTGAGAWDHPRTFDSLRDAVGAAINDAAPPAQVAWILTSGGHTLKPADIEDLWLRLRG